MIYYDCSVDSSTLRNVRLCMFSRARVLANYSPELVMEYTYYYVYTS